MPKKRRKKKGSGIDSLKKQQMAANYGFALAFMKSDPELWKLFNTAVKKTWDPNMFVARLRATKWFKKHSAPVRNAIMQKTADPATYKANVDKMTATLLDTWGDRYGVGRQSAAKTNKWIHGWAERAYRLGWNEAEALDHMSKGINYQRLLRRTDVGGQVIEVRGQLKELEDAYGLNMGDKWKARQMEKIIEGDSTIGGVTDVIREYAKQEYGAFADQIDAGKTMQEIASPYVERAAELLERNPNDINIKNEALIHRALTMRDDKGRPAAMNLSDFAKTVRSDSRWQYTANAKKEVANVTGNLLQSFGLMA